MPPYLHILAMKYVITLGIFVHLIVTNSISLWFSLYFLSFKWSRVPLHIFKSHLYLFSENCLLIFLANFFLLGHWLFASRFMGVLYILRK